MSVTAHRADAPVSVPCLVLTVSDTRTRETDTSGDAIAGWVYAGIVAVASTGGVAIAGAALAGLWGLIGFIIGRRHDRTIKS